MTLYCHLTHALCAGRQDRALRWKRQVQGRFLGESQADWPHTAWRCATGRDAGAALYDVREAEDGYQGGGFAGEEVIEDNMSEEQHENTQPGSTENLPLAIENVARVVYMMARDGLIGIDTGAPPELAEMARNALGLLGSLVDAAEERRRGESGA